MRHNGGVLFEPRLQSGLRDGSIHLAFRRWRRAQVVAGRQYRSPIGMVTVDAVSVIADVQAIRLEDSRAAGYASVEQLLEDLKGPVDGAVYRLELHHTAAPDPRSVLADNAQLGEADLQTLRRKLDRLDAARPSPWTRRVLREIKDRPGTRAGDLAQDLGWPELLEFKLHVRKLKAIGLTLSLQVGYELSPRGKAYLQSTASD